MNTYVFITEYGSVSVDAANYISAFQQLSLMFPEWVSGLMRCTVIRHGINRG